MRKSILIVAPMGAGNSPVDMRTASTIHEYERSGYAVETISPAAGRLALLRAAYRNGSVFVTMPPFRKFWLLALPGVKATVDWRDGWSLAMKTGYGGNAPVRPWRGAAAKLVELASIVLSERIVTCTPGLFNYHASRLPGIFKRKLALVPNGHQMRVEPSRFRKRDLTGKGRLVAVCTGKFFAYGKANVEAALDTLAARYAGKDILIRVIGSSDGDRADLERIEQRPGIVVQWEPRKPYAEVVEDIAAADLAIAVIRDQAYDFGTKMFDYVAAGTPVLDVFTDPAFREYFSGCFDTDYDPVSARQKADRFARHNQVAGFLGEPGDEAAISQQILAREG